MKPMVFKQEYVGVWVGVDEDYERAYNMWADYKYTCYCQNLHFESSITVFLRKQVWEKANMAGISHDAMVHARKDVSRLTDQGLVEYVEKKLLAKTDQI